MNSNPSGTTGFLAFLFVNVTKQDFPLKDLCDRLYACKFLSGPVQFINSWLVHLGTVCNRRVGTALLQFKFAAGSESMSSPTIISRFIIVLTDDHLSSFSIYPLQTYLWRLSFRFSAKLSVFQNRHKKSELNQPSMEIPALACHFWTECRFPSHQNL